MVATQEIISAAVRTDYAATTVWEVAKSPAALHLWHPAIVSSKLENDLREVVLDGGAVIVERITSSDNSTHSYSYVYVEGPLAMPNFTSTFTVSPHGEGGSEVLWSARFDKGESSGETAAMVDQMYRAGLQGLSEYLDTVLGTVHTGEVR